MLTHVFKPRLRLRFISKLEGELAGGPSAAVLIAIAPPFPGHGPQADLLRVILDSADLARGLGEVYVRARFGAIRKKLSLLWQKCIVMPVEAAGGEDEIALCPRRA